MKKISSLEYNTFIWFIIKSCFAEITFGSIIFHIRQDIWISTLLGIIIGLIPFYVYEKLKQKFPSDNYLTLNKKFFKNYSNIINIIMFIGLLIILISIFWILVYFTNSLFLPKTSPWIISIALIIPIGYTSTKDIHIIGKVSLIIFYLSLIINIIIFIGLLENVDLNNIKPILENSPQKIFSSSSMFITLNIAKLFLLTIISKQEINNYSKKNNVLTYILTCTNIMSTIILTLCVFGINLTELYEFPAFQILKRVNILGAIDRMENILSLESIFSNFIQIILIMYFERKIITHSFKANKKTNKYIIILICLFTLILSNSIFITYETGKKFFEKYLTNIICFTCIIIPTITLLKSLIYKEQTLQ